MCISLNFDGDGCLFSLKPSNTNTCVYELHNSSWKSQLWLYRLTVLWMQNKPVKKQQRFYPFFRIRERYAACSAGKSNIPDRNCWVRDLQVFEDSSEYGEVVLLMVGHLKWLVSSFINDKYSEEIKHLKI